MLRSYKLPIALAYIILISSCKIGTRFYSSEDAVNVRVTTSCRNPVITLTLKESELKQVANDSGISSSKKFKIKRTTTSQKADYIIISTNLHINEQCIAGSTSPIIKVSHAVKLEHVRSKEKLEFTADSSLIDQQSLTQPAKKAPNLYLVIPALTEQNYKKIKAHAKR